MPKVALDEQDIDLLLINHSMNGTPKELNVNRARLRRVKGQTRKTFKPCVVKKLRTRNSSIQKQSNPVARYHPSKTGHHAHSPSADRAAYFRTHEYYRDNCPYGSDSDSDSENENVHKRRRHKHHCCCCDCCDVRPPCGWYPEAPCLGNCCGGYDDGINGYVVYDTGNPFCTSRPGAYVSPNALLPWTNALPYSNLCSPCGNYGTEWDAGNPRPPPIPTPAVVPLNLPHQIGRCADFC